jgi:hypothetical protein
MLITILVAAIITIIVLSKLKRDKVNALLDYSNNKSSEIYGYIKSKLKR